MIKGNLSIVTINILFVFFIKSVASGLSIIDFFSLNQINYFFELTALSQVLFFTLSLGHTSDKNFSIFNKTQLIYAVLRIVFVIVLFFLFQSKSVEIIISALFFSMLMFFNAFVDFRVKYYRLYLTNYISFFSVVLISFSILILCYKLEASRIIIQIVPFFIFSLFIFFTFYGKKNIWFIKENELNKTNKMLFSYALLSSLYTYFDRSFIVKFGSNYNKNIFFIVNIFSFIVFFLDYYFKRSAEKCNKFIYALIIFNFLSVLFLLILDGYRLEVYYVSILLFQFFVFSFYLITKSNKIVIFLICYFSLVCIVIFLGINDFILFYNVYFICYFIQVIFSILIVYFCREIDVKSN